MASEEFRETVLAWMAEKGRGYKAASKRFGVPIEQVAEWGREERERAGKGARGDSVHHAPRPQTRARAKPAADDEPARAEPKTRAGHSSTILTPDSLNSEARRLLRKAAHRHLLILAGEDEEGNEVELNPQYTKSAALALGILVDKCPNILNLETATDEHGSGHMGGDGSLAGEDAARRLRAALAGEEPG